MRNAETQAGSLPAELRAGWRPLLAATLGSGAGYGLFQTTAGLFIKPMQTEFGWATSTVAIAPVILLLGAFMLPVGGLVVDRWGARPVAILGLALFVLTYLMLGALPPEKLALYGLVGFIAVISPLGYNGAFLKVVGGWFRQNAGFAIGVCMSGVTISTAIALPLLGFVIDHWGWRAGYLALAGFTLMAGLPIVVLLLRERPAQPLAQSDAPAEPSVLAAADGADDIRLRGAFNDLRFWLLLVSSIAGTLPIGAYLAHLQPLLRDAHLNAQTAATVGVFLAVAMGVGRLAGGFLLDRFWAYGTAALFLVPPVLSVWYFAELGRESSFLLLALAAMVLGLAHGAKGVFMPFFTLALFGRRYFTTIYSFLTMASLFGSALGGIAFSLLYDRFGDYKLGSYVAGFLFLVSAALLLIAGAVDYRIRRRPAA